MSRLMPRLYLGEMKASARRASGQQQISREQEAMPHCLFFGVARFERKAAERLVLSRLRDLNKIPCRQKQKQC